MRRLSFLLGLTIGFVIGSRAGTGPYQQLADRVRSVTDQPEVRDTVEDAKTVTKERVGEAVNDAVAKAHQAVDSVSHGSTPPPSPASSSRSSTGTKSAESAA